MTPSVQASTKNFQATVERAAQRFRTCGRGPYYFARGKLGGDPIFSAVLNEGLIPNNAHIVDIGCGQGVLAALLAAAQQTFEHSPNHWTLSGFDLRTRAIHHGQQALADLGARVRLTVGDARQVPLPSCQIAIIFDVLHYMDHAAQEDLLQRVYHALDRGGSLLLRVGPASTHWRFRFTLLCDWLVTWARGTPWPRFWCRPLDEWTGLLTKLGFTVEAKPMSQGTPFANVLLVCTRQK